MRWLSLTAGLLLLALLWLGPLPRMARSAFFAHMTLHMGVVAVAAPLIALGLAGGRFDPVIKAPHVFSPVPASMVEFAVVWAWHAPRLHDVSHEYAGGFLLEQAMFFVSGLALWLSAVGGQVRWQPSRTGAGVIAILLTSMHMTLLGALIALAPRLLYSHASSTTESAAAAPQTDFDALCRFPGSITDLTALEDQQLGGTIMLFVGGAAYLAGGLWLMAKLLQHRNQEAAA